MANRPPPRRGEIWWVDFDPAFGSEIRKTRPAVVVSLDSIGRLPLRVVLPVTDWKPHYVTFPWMTELPADNINNLSKDSAADAFQVKSVSLTRFSSYLGTVSSEQLEAMASAVALCVGAS